MRRLAILNILLLLGAALVAQDKILIHQVSSTEVFEISDTDSAYFSSDRSIMYFAIGGILSEYAVEDIDSITFEPAVDSIVSIEYNGTTATVVNPLENAGIMVTVFGADVYISALADMTGVSYIVSGSTDDGLLKLYSEESFNLLLDNVDLTNDDGPAINIQSGKKARVTLVDGTTNTLTDGSVYADPVVGGEDQKAAFFSEGKLVFNGSGSLVINSFGSEQHALGSDDYVKINDGNITVTSAVKDGIHGKDGFFMEGGSVAIASSGDGVDGDEGLVEITGGSLLINSSSDDVSAIHSDSTLTISGGDISINLEGDQSKGIDSNKEIFLSGGTITVETSGGIVLESSGLGYDPSYCTAVHSNGDITISATELLLDILGEAGRGISCDGNLYVNSGNIAISAEGDGATYTNVEGSKDAYHGSCVKVDGNLAILDGSMTLSNSGSGGKGILSDGDLVVGGTGTSPLIEVTTTGSEIQISSTSSRPGPSPGDDGESDEAKAIKSDGAVVINSGNIIISSADDGIKSLTSITLNEGVIDIQKSFEGLESPNITINAGELSIISSDDGFNATYGNGGEGDDGSLLSINGGYSTLSSTKGDPMDSNGSISITAGTTVVHGPQSNVEVGLDVNGDCIISGGFLVISGSNSFMTEGASDNSTQNSLLIQSSSSIAANTIFHIEDESGNNILTFAPSREYYSIVFSSPELLSNTAYRIYTGGICTGDLKDGLYTGGSYTGGTLRKNFVTSSTVTDVSF